MMGGTPCYLGALAPELVDNILLEINSVHDLFSFILTAAFIYARFKEQKQFMIFHVLQNELGPVLTDAKFLCIFPHADPVEPESRAEHWEWIHKMAALYKNMLGGSGESRLPTILDLTKLCRTLHGMNHLASIYIATQKCLFGNEDLAAASISRVERLRILRAFYRRQITSNALSPKRQPRWVEEDVAAISNTSSHQGVRPGLFSAFEPWELQHIEHADYFITHLCVALRLAGEEAVAAPAPKDSSTQVVLVQPIGETEFGDIFSHVDSLVRYVREYPSLADAALRALPLLLLQLATSPGDLDASSLSYQFVQRYPLLCLHFGWQSHRAKILPDPSREELEEQRQEREGAVGPGCDATLNFVGDAVDLPPFGWVDALDGYYANWFGQGLVFIPWVPLPHHEQGTLRARYTSLMLWRGAGFAFWDRWRVEALKELHLLKTLRRGWVVY